VNFRILAATMTACLLVAPRSLAAQTTAEVTFKVPVNLTQVSPDIAKVGVMCMITSSAIPIVGRNTGTSTSGNVYKQVEIPMAGGQLVTTATVVLGISGPSALTDPVGKTADYRCTLSGFSTSLQTWALFDAASAQVQYRLSPTPAPLTGTFTW
jgi:hypothetical protein